MQRSRQQARFRGRRGVLHAALWLLLTAGGLATGFVALPALADDPGGMRLRLGIEQRVEAGRNLGLTVPAEGSTALSTTRFSAAFNSETRTQRLSISADSALRFGRTPAGSVRGLDDPRLRFSYRREGTREELRLDGDWRRSQVEFLRALSDFVGEDGIITLPEDFEDLTGTGQRTDYSLRGRLELGRDLPLGLVVNARHSAIRYSDTTNPDLFDTRREGLDATLRLQLAPVATARLTAGRERYRADDAEQTRRVTDRLDLGLDYEISPVLRMDAGIGWRRIDTTEFGTTTRRQGLAGRLGFDLERPDGRYSLGYDAGRDQTGLRQTLRVDRVLARPDGEIRGGIGVTRSPNGSNDVIGDLAWRRDLPDGRLTARLSRSVTTTSDDETRLRTVLSLGWQQEINAVSSFGLGLDHSRSAATATANRLDRTDLSARYTHQLTRDWALNVGASYGLRNEQGVGRSSAPLVFLTLGRQFDFRL